jgi:uncharacterized protein
VIAVAPERTCVGCRERAPKPTLVRVARVRDGEVLVDPSGSAPGRGAYMHLDAGCIDAAMRSGAFGRALRTGLTADAAARLRTGLERLMGAM